MQQHIAAGFQVVRARILDLVVADAVLAGHEDHPGRGDPGRVTFTVDLRHGNDAGLDRMDVRIRAACAALQAKGGVSVTIEQTVYFPPAIFAEQLVRAVREGAERAGLPHQDIVSGAGHDAVYVARVAPAAMIFVPCKDGISHNEIEDAKPDHLAAGCNVLLHAMLDQAGIAA